jgi:hypothetical protein
MLKRRFMMLAILVFVASMVFAAAPAMGANGSVGFAWIRVAHASPDAPAVDIWVDDVVAVTNLSFAEVTGYLLVPAGDHNIKVTPTGATEPVVIDADVTLDKSVAYTVAARNLLATIAPEVYVDDNSWPAPGKAKARFIHLSPDAPAVDVGVVGGGNLFTNVSFPNASGYVEVPEGVYDLEVKLAGTSTVVLTIPDVDLQSGTVYTAFAEGLAAGTPPLQAVFGAFAPKGHVWYLAEGSTEGTFETFILVQNPNDEPATVGLTFMTDTGAVPGPMEVLEPNSRITWKANDYVTNWNVSTLVTSNKPVIAERAMYGNNRTFAHDSIGVVSPALTWYLAEGSTAGTFETYILVQNPGENPANVELTFMTDTGPTPGPSKMLEPHSRWTWKANDYVISFDLSTMVTSNQPVIAERAMYGDNRTWAHDSIGYTP